MHSNGLRLSLRQREVADNPDVYSADVEGGRVNGAGQIHGCPFQEVL